MESTDESFSNTPGDWCGSPSKTQNKNQKRDDNRDSDDRLGDLPEWLEEFADNLEDTEVPAPGHISHYSDSERPTEVDQEAQYLCSLPKRSKLRSMLANQNDKGSLQKAHWRSSTSRRKNW